MKRKSTIFRISHSKNMANFTKTCSRCGKSKILDDFPRDKTKSGGYKSICKVCNCAVVKSYKTELKKLKEEDPIVKLRQEFMHLTSILTPENFLELQEKLSDLALKITGVRVLDSEHSSEGPEEILEVNDLPIENLEISESGAIYIVSSPDMIALQKYKIGMHTGSQQKLLQRYGTALINPMIIYFRKVDNPREIEKRILETLDSRRIVNENGHKTEWVNATDFLIINVIQDVMATFL
jgi:hypothetical protein